jgi:hypothetical protein
MLRRQLVRLLAKAFYIRPRPVEDFSNRTRRCFWADFQTETQSIRSCNPSATPLEP